MASLLVSVVKSFIQGGRTLSNYCTFNFINGNTGHQVVITLDSNAYLACS